MNLQKTNALPHLKAIRAFDSLSESNKKYLSDHATSIQATKGKFLWRKSDPGEFCALITEGLVEIVDLNSKGDERIISVFGPGEIIGLSAIIRRVNFPASAKVASPQCKVIKFFIRSMDSDLTSLDKANMTLWQRERLLAHEQILRDKIEILGAGSLSKRVVELFFQLKMRFEREQDSKSLKTIIPIPISKSQIARLVEARVESIIRLLNSWEKAGYVVFDKKRVVINNLEKLRDLG